MKLEDIPVVQKVLDVFLDDLPSVLIERGIEFGIDVIPRTQLISRSPYRMALVKLKTQL